MPFGIPENFEASSRGLPHKLIGSCVMPFVVDMSMCFFLWPMGPRIAELQD